MGSTTLAHATFLMVLLAGGAAAAQNPPSTSGVKTSSTEDAKPPKLVISIDRIRELLTEPAPVQQSLEKRPTFRIQVEERDKLAIFLSRALSLEPADTRPPVPGGTQAYEQQRIALSAIDRGGTRMEPYATFSGAELVTLAIEGLARKYLGGRALDAVTDIERTRAQASARQEISQAIGEYCTAQAGDGTAIRICAEQNGVRP